MNFRKLIPFVFTLLLFTSFAATPRATADSSHARIIRLSLVQGDVRVSLEAPSTPLAYSTAAWETAELNLPIRQSYLLATDNGRAEVEFENGNLAFLKENTILEFYDLSLKDGSRITRLVLRQGSASFNINPVDEDYFSVTGGDFTVEATSRSRFRLDNFDDGSTVEAVKGHVSILYNKNTTELAQGQSLSVKAGNGASLNVGRVGEADDFDSWVSGRMDSVGAATKAAGQYTSSPFYASGFADLYTFGSFSPCGGYGYGWRPFGVGSSWSPFSSGQWVWDNSFGWTWMSFQPWGWAPYHYGGWLFDSGCGGWFYLPPGAYGVGGVGPIGNPRKRFPRGIHPPHPLYRPVTGVFVRDKGKMGIVPVHPLDEKGKTPRNLEHGVFSPVLVKGMSERMPSGEFGGGKQETLKTAPREALTGSLIPTTAPLRVSRTIGEGGSGARFVSHGAESSIFYDPKEHRFVNGNALPATGNAKESGSEVARRGVAGSERSNGGAVRSAATPGVTPSPRAPATPSMARGTAPPPAPRSSGGSAGSSSGSSSAGSGAGRSSSGSSSSGSSSAGSGSHPSGGRPH